MTYRKSLLTFVDFVISIYFRNIPYTEEYGTLFNFIFNTIFAPIMALPFMYVAEWVRTSGLLNKRINNFQQILSFVISFAVLLIFAQPQVDFESASFSIIYPFMYLSAFGGIYALAILCKRINKLFFFSYVGRYSIIVLGTHWVFLLALRGLVDLNRSLEFLIIILMMPPTIWLFKKLFPYFTAQKDLFNYKGGQR